MNRATRVRATEEKTMAKGVAVKVRGETYYLSVGDRVTMRWDYLGGDVNAVRTITAIEPNDRFGSGAMASASEGERCPTCGHTKSPAIYSVDASYFIPAGAVTSG
jgi:hypothetical protein